jgi:hypothetical protein
LGCAYPTNDSSSHTLTPNDCCLFVCAALGCFFVPRDTPINVAEGSKYCTILSGDRPWNRPPERDFFGYGYEFRWPGASRDAVLFTIDRANLNREIGPQPIYRITLTAPARITSATEADWRTGVKLALSPGPGEMTFALLQGEDPTHPGEYPTRIVTRDSRVFSPNGHPFPKSGDIWSPDRPVLSSPRGNYFALESYNGWLADKTSGDGPFFIDVFRGSTSKRVALIRGSRWRMTPEAVFHYLGWVTDSDLLMPFPYHDLPEVLVCHFDG